jgi:ferredoxin
MSHTMRTIGTEMGGVSFGSRRAGRFVAPRGAEMCDLDKHPSYARCVACGQCFTSDSTFDRHQRANYRARRRENVVKCLDPAEVKRGEQGLVFDEAVGAWR